MTSSHFTHHRSVEKNHIPAHIICSDQEALDVAKKLSEQFKTHAVQRDQQRILPFQEIDMLSQSGLWAISVPKQYGGADVSTYTIAQVIALLSGADGSIGQIPQNHFYALEVLRNTGTEEQKKRLYTEVLNGARFGNALAEFKSKTSAQKHSYLTPHGKGYVIQGEKFYCTGSLFAHRISTLVKDQQGHEFLAFIPKDAEGLTIIDDWTAFGQRLTGSGTVKLENVYVDAEDVVAFSDVFLKPTLVGPYAQLLHASIEVGIARAAFEETLHHVKDARPWIDANVTSATQDPLTLYELGQIAVDVKASELLLKKAAQSIHDIKVSQANAENIAQASIDVARVRAHSTDTALKASSKLIELAGSRGSRRNKGLDRYWRNTRVHTLHDAARWKYYFIGNYVLNQILPPRRGTL
ncbi:SfnB family sulfur acquisition oxidoreductase [Acinetobacter sp. B5B]|uniref:SfnB family sulfur acquisition oxidoreductase n=1 Tax=Acinetobacter baretiae TaxID=2605383 RepID=UPI0018C29933|nr:SfnB family sulfur acquisition oxidoreductase [Acinetobacter baretiae]MBF7683264.1 SfnB family sulfur acquisition oxidoreductase [Acinetobacter baretiae]